MGVKIKGLGVRGWGQGLGLWGWGLRFEFPMARLGVGVQVSYVEAIRSRDWSFVAEQPASAPHRQGIVPHTVPRVDRSYEHFPDRFELHLQRSAAEPQEVPPKRRGNTQNVQSTVILKPRPQSGLDCLTCAIFARQRCRGVEEHATVGVEG